MSIAFIANRRRRRRRIVPPMQWQCSRHLERSRQTDEIAAERSIIEYPLGIDDGEEEEGRGRCKTKLKRNVLEIRPRFSLPAHNFLSPCNLRLVNCASPDARSQILLVEFFDPANGLSFSTNPKDFPATARARKIRITEGREGRGWMEEQRQKRRIRWNRREERKKRRREKKIQEDTQRGIHSDIYWRGKENGLQRMEYCPV